MMFLRKAGIRFPLYSKPIHASSAQNNANYFCDIFMTRALYGKYFGEILFETKPSTFLQIFCEFIIKYFVNLSIKGPDDTSPGYLQA